MGLFTRKRPAAGAPEPPAPPPVEEPRPLADDEVVLLVHDHGNRLVARPAEAGWASYLVWGDGAPDLAEASAPTWDALLVSTADRLGRNQVLGAHPEADETTHQVAQERQSLECTEHHRSMACDLVAQALWI